MIDSSLVPNEVTYNVMIDRYCRVGNVRKAFQLYDQMVDRGLTPDNYTYRSLISVLCLVLGASKAKEFVNDLENSCAVLQL
jgi:pentatricopeptide repeat protein